MTRTTTGIAPVTGMTSSTQSNRKHSGSGGGTRAEVRGIVSPVGWDEDGRVVAVCIATDQGSPCFILPGGAGSEVRDHLKRYVSAAGRIERRRGVDYMRVESVEPVPNPDGLPEGD